MLAILFLHLKIEIKYLTTKGPKPRRAFKRKAFKVHGKQVTFHSFSTWTTWFFSSSVFQAGLKLSLFQGLQDSDVTLLPSQVVLHLGVAITVLCGLPATQRHRENPASAYVHLRYLVLSGCSLIKTSSDPVSPAAHFLWSAYVKVYVSYVTCKPVFIPMFIPPAREDESTGKVLGYLLSPFFPPHLSVVTFLSLKFP